MTDKQAAETLRTRYLGDTAEHREAAERGADAIEMLEWLFEREPSYGSYEIRISALFREWDGSDSPRAFCEAKWRESRNA